MFHSSMMAAMADLIDVPDKACLEVGLQKATACLGFDRFVLGVEINRPIAGRLQPVTNGSPLAWQQIYQDKNHIKFDPTVAQGGPSDAPPLWTDRLRNSPSSQREDPDGHGLASGFSLSTHEKNGITSMITLVRDQPVSSDADEARHMHNCARVLSACAHVATVRTLEPSILERHDLQLSKREKECITWAAHGKTAEEIGEQLHISEPTVVFHINKVVRKLGVRNRMHAVAISVALGLVN